jgi:hypothetical protein
MQRSHRRRDDLSWLAPEVARAQRRAAWSVWGGSAVAIGGTVAMLPPLLLFWKGFVLAGAGIAAAGHQVGRMTLQRQLRKLAAGQLPLSALDARAAGELVVVRGRIECAAPLTGILVDRPARVPPPALAPRRALVQRGRGGLRAGRRRRASGDGPRRRRALDDARGRGHRVSRCAPRSRRAARAPARGRAPARDDPGPRAGPRARRRGADRRTQGNHRLGRWRGHRHALAAAAHQPALGARPAAGDHADRRSRRRRDDG